jgi:hypothetical protein
VVAVEVFASALTPARTRRDARLGAIAWASSSTFDAGDHWNGRVRVCPPQSVETSQVENGGVNGDIVSNNRRAATVFSSMVR